MKKNKNINLNVFKELFGFYTIEYKKLYLLAFVVIISGIIQSMVPLSIKYLTDDFITRNNLSGFIYAGIFFMGLILVATLTIYGFYVLGGKLEYKVSMEIRSLVFSKIERLSLSTIKKYEMGELISRLTSDIQKLSEVFSWGIIDACHSVILLIISIIIMIYLSFKLTIILFLMVPIIYFVSVFFQKNILKYQRNVRKYNARMIKSNTEAVTYTKTIKSLGIESEKFKEFLVYNDIYKNNALKSALISAIFVPMVMFIASIAVAIAFNYSSITVMNDMMTYGAFLSFLTYSLQLFEPFKLLAQIFTDLKSAEASAERVFKLLHEEEEKVENKIIDNEFKGNIIFENVDFHYTDDDFLVLKDFNFEIKQGQSVAFVGSTGSGKSTIVNLICKFYEPTSGKIYLEGIDYKNISKNHLYDNLGYVLQQPQLFSISIKENIKFGNEDATDEEINEICELLGLNDFIKNFPEGINTVIGEKGYSLSNGQNQLISFARALIRKPKLLILDEATSSIDTETEKIIQDKMKYILKDKTSIIIAHRLSTVKDCDIIVMINNGSIIEMGNHEELINKKGIYYKMYVSEELNI